MSLEWIKEHDPRWDEDKQRIIGDAPDGIFDRRYSELDVGDSIPCEWWRVEDNGRTLGYGWLDAVWGDAEILLATDQRVRGKGVGTFVLEHLDRESRQRGLNYLYNVIRPAHPQADELGAWLAKRGFEASTDGSWRRTVKR